MWSQAMNLAYSVFRIVVPKWCLSRNATPRNKNSLFISYDGLLDPLGASQILPYLRAIATEENQLHILSFEKRERYQTGAGELVSEFANSRICWTPLIFTRSGGTLGKLWDLLKMHAAALHIACRLRPSVVHARSHGPAQVGLLLKRLFKVKLLFDFRGLWVDERVDKGSWKLTNPWHRMQYRYYKHVERNLLRHSDHVVVLTKAVCPEVIRLGVSNSHRVTVIPCSADFTHFQLTTPERRHQARHELEIPEASFVMGYLGSVGGMYLTEKFLQLAQYAQAHHPRLHVLVLTPDCRAFLQLAHHHLSRQLKPIVHTLSANREQVPQWLPAMDLLVSFISPTYARMASSPTKLAEAWASGIPALCNSGVGDVDQMVKELDAGMVINTISDEDLQTAAKALPTLTRKGGARLRHAAQARLSLDVAAERYLGIYRLLRS